MLIRKQTAFKALILLSTLLSCSSQAAIIKLTGTLSAANQNGSDPTLVTDPNGIVQTDATGKIVLLLDDVNMTLDMKLGVKGITLTDLLDFGPNASPIHLHNAGGGGTNPGNFGPISIDPTFTASTANYVDGTPLGFGFVRKDISILAADQGQVGSPNMHPGDDKIVDALLSGNMFVAVHTNKDIFINTAAGRPDGFPFVEIRGNFAPVSAVPVPAALPLLGSGLIALFAMARRRVIA